MKHGALVAWLMLGVGCGPVISDAPGGTDAESGSSTGQATMETAGSTGSSTPDDSAGSTTADDPATETSGSSTTSDAASSSGGAPVICGSPLLDPEDRLQISSSPMRGNPDAYVTLVLWTGFNDPFSLRVQETIDDLLAGPLGEDVRIVSKQMPLRFQDPGGRLARAGLAAHALGDYWAFHDAMFAFEGELDEEDAFAIAEQVGLDLGAFEAAMNSDPVDEQLTADMTLFASLGGMGTPSWATNGLLSVGAQPLEVFESVVGQELAEMQALVDAGLTPCAAYEERLDELLP